MRKLLFAAAAAAALVAAVPASAQVYLGADPGGAGVQVGPFGSASARAMTTGGIATLITPTARSARWCASAS